MNEIGKLLIEARLSRNLELEQVARETNITKRYLEGLETDNYEVLPDEARVVGFLRNYCEYLELNPEEIITLYKQIKIQESEVPHEALLPKKGGGLKSVFLAAVFLAVIAAIGAAVYAGVFKWYPRIKERQAVSANDEPKVIQTRETAVYELTDESFEKRLFEGDSLVLSGVDSVHTVKIKKIAQNLVFETELGEQVIGLGQSIKLDFNDDLTVDMEISLEDIDKNNAEAGVLLSVLTGDAAGTPGNPNAADVIAADDGSFSNLRAGRHKVLFESGSAYPVTLTATFRGYCLFRHEPDKSNREEKYYQKGEQLTVQANNGFRIWASNGNMVKLRLTAGGKTVDLEVSRPGEVIVKELKWIKDDVTKRFKFIAADVE